MDKDDIIKDYIAYLRNIAILSDEDLIKIVNRWIKTDPKNLDIIKEILYNNDIARFTTLTFAESATFKTDQSNIKDSGTEISKTIKTIDRLIEDINLRLAEYIDGKFYLPLKEELKGTTHSLGFKKESLKENIESELERLKKELKEIRPKID